MTSRTYIITSAMVILALIPVLFRVIRIRRKNLNIRERMKHETWLLMPCLMNMTLFSGSIWKTIRINPSVIPSSMR